MLRMCERLDCSSILQLSFGVNEIHLSVVITYLILLLHACRVLASNRQKCWDSCLLGIWIAIEVS
jgi:hypothetical protein